MRRSESSFRGFALAMAACVVAIIVLADLGTAGAAFALAHRVPGGDVTWHFVLYGVLALAVAGWVGARWQDGRSVVVALLVLALLIGLEECSQLWLANRTFSFVDLTASYAGVLAGGLIARSTRAAPGGP